MSREPPNGPGLDSPGPHKWWTLAVVGSGTFMAALDGSVVNVALPVIQRTTGAPLSTVEWTVLIYYLVLSSLLVVFGRLADLHGRRIIYMAGQVLFVAGSLGCGLAGTVYPLIGARALQALGAAMMLALSPAILVAAFPGTERGRALGLQSSLTYLGLTVGPGLGGFLIQHFGWPAIFFINVPVGLGALALAGVVLKPDRRSTRPRFDWAGAGLLAGACAALLFALSKGGPLGWTHPVIAGCTVAGAGCLAAFVILERRQADPALNLRLFSNRTFALSVLAAYCGYVATAATGFLMPFFLLEAGGRLPAQAGLVLMTVPVAMLLVTGLSGALSDRIGVRLPATTGLVLLAAGMYLLGGLDPGVPDGAIAWLLTLTGLGTGLFTAPNNSAIMGSVPADQQGVAGAILGMMRTMGFASGVALAGCIYLAVLGGQAALPGPAAVAQAVHVGMRGMAVAALIGAVCSLVRRNPARGRRLA